MPRKTPILVRTVWLPALLAAGVLAAACRPPAATPQQPAPQPALHAHDAGALEAVRASLAAGEGRYRPAYDALLAEADALRDAAFATVMDKPVAAPSGDPHDYYSTAPYWWPDTTKPGGLPYVRRDGHRNPESSQLDESAFDAVLDAVPTLAWAAYFSGDDRYARKAAEVLRAWFVDPATRMNPNLRHAQAVPGIAEGRKYGIIEAQHFYAFVDALAVLRQHDALAADEWEALDRWFGDYLGWLRESTFGRAEANTANNHATAYDAQTAALALYLGRDDVARNVLAAFPARRIDTQIEPDGRQPEELARTRSFGYSVYNLYHAFNAATLAPHVGVDLFGYASPDGRSLRAAFDYVVPAAGRRDRWPHPQLDGTWEGAEARLSQLLRRAAVAYGDPRYEHARLRLAGPDESARYQLLHPLRPEDNLTDASTFDAEAALAEAARRLRPLLDDPAGAGALPRSVEPDGTLRTSTSREWTSGFYPGLLWELYDYTRDPAFERAARRWTALVVPEKDNAGTHDMGFKIYCSVGGGYRLTGDPHYRDVLVESARTLVTRFDPAVGAIRSWDWGTWRFPVIIDNMMNLELLFAATRLTGDSTFYHVAERHARTTLRDHFRDDHSSYHVVQYDTSTGAVLHRGTHQGFSDASAWSRGQAWGLYGFTMVYRETGDPVFLEQARRIARFLLTHPHLPEDYVPYWDFDAPDIPDAPRDASAAAVTASALYELSGYVPAADSARYVAAADRMAASLASAAYRAPEDTPGPFLLAHSTGSVPGGFEVDSPIIYADYYYVEALLRRLRMGQ